MSALLNPVNPTREGIKWLLVVHTVAISLFVTVFTAINLDILSGSYIDNRDVRGYVDTPGPLGYQAFTFSTPIGIVSTVTFLLNNLLVDGLLVRFVSDSVARGPTQAAPLALPLLHYVFHEPPGNCLPLHFVPRHYRYVSGPPQTFERDFG